MLLFNFQFIKEIYKNLQISKLEWYLKGHVTVKTEVMTAENSALPSQE